MDYSEGVKYYFMRLLLLLGTDAVGLVLGKGTLWVVSSILPLSEDVQKFLVSDTVGSFAAAIIMLILLGMVFYDDGKSHAAYDSMDFTYVLTVMLLLVGVYFIPVIFYNPADITRAVSTAYDLFYYPCRWVREIFGADIKTSVAVGIGVIYIILFVIYQISYTRYRKKHPFVFKIPDEDEID